MVASTESCPQFDGNNFVLLKIWLSSRKNQNVILVDLPLGVYMGPVTYDGLRTRWPHAGLYDLPAAG
jgi:hypothetical protein